MFENLTDRLERSFKILKGEGKITEINVAETVKEIRKALIEADVNYKVAKTFTDEVKRKALGMNVLNAIKPGQLMVKVVHDELVSLMGGQATDINLAGNPTVILIAGLQGSGKTTFSAKLANHLKNKKGKSPLLVAGDVYRPAAIEQLKVLGQQINVPVFTIPGSNDPIGIAREAVRLAKNNNQNVVIIDTAGRLHNKVNLMNELSKIKRVMQKVIPDAPHEVLLVLDGSTGQNAFEQAKQFTLATDVSALALTKLDGTAKGGVVIGISDQFKIPVKYIGIGEKITDLQLFDRFEFVDSLFS